jgi:hypothetical protein
MADEAAPERSLTIPEAAELRGKTEAISKLLQTQLEAHLDTLRPLFAPRRLLGKHMGGSAGRDDVPGADKALAALKQRYKEVVGPPFVLRPELSQETVSGIESRIELYPWEYDHEAATETETRTIAIKSPVRWVMSFDSDYSLSQVRRVLAGEEEKRAEDLAQFVANALAMGAVVEKFPALQALLHDLRFEVRVETANGLGKLPVVTVNSNLTASRPPDELILAATGFSGVAAFIELVDRDAVQSLHDPLRERLEKILS